ncbi:MAG TPA: dinitrogenase iron-molybdenum cofactor biosynthesis protein, partial [Thermodesulfobacterium commune]|nr:dinitrogenase iron-molybdenum cofactor biosynthesis protein [Thermodesulfobacterium commune]
MKICIVSQGKDLEAEIDSRFGRCRYFVFYDTETGEYEVIENTWRE